MDIQMQLFYDTQQQQAGKYRAFLAMAFDPVEPLTKRELIANIQRNPATWKCFESWLDGDKLAD